MLLRLSAPQKPTVLIDLGPAHGERHLWDLMRRTVDDQKAWERPTRPIHNVRLERAR